MRQRSAMCVQGALNNTNAAIFLGRNRIGGGRSLRHRTGKNTTAARNAANPWQHLETENASLRTFFPDAPELAMLRPSSVKLSKFPPDDITIVEVPRFQCCGCQPCSLRASQSSKFPTSDIAAAKAWPSSSTTVRSSAGDVKTVKGPAGRRYKCRTP
ncbi:hypothetical protein FHS20_002390 [Phyllobacterium endophyticum]|nr:hypothetical protein [Phyllobacterium endophyticum]